MLQILRPDTEPEKVDNRSLEGTLRLCHFEEYKHDMARVCEMVDNRMKEAYNSGSISENDRLTLPLEDGSTLRFTMKEGSVEISHREGYNTEILYSKELSAEEYADRFGAFCEKYGKDIGIGEPCPESVKQALKNLKEGDIISFGGIYDRAVMKNQKTPLMVCISNDEKGVDLLECLDVAKYDQDIDYEKFTAGRILNEKIHLDYNKPADMQYFYLSVKNPVTDAASIASTRIESVFRETYDRVCQELGEGKDGITELRVTDHNKLLVEKKGDDLLFFDKEGHKLSNNNIGLYLAWSRSIPTIVEPQLKSKPEIFEDPLRVADRTEDMQAYETAVNEGDFEKAASRLADYCKHWCTDVELTVHNDGVPVNYKFAYDLNNQNHVQTCIILKEDKDGYHAVSAHQFSEDVALNIQRLALLGINDKTNTAPEYSNNINGYSSKMFIKGCNIVLEARESSLNKRTNIEKYFIDGFNDKGKFYDSKSER